MSDRFTPRCGDIVRVACTDWPDHPYQGVACLVVHTAGPILNWPGALLWLQPPGAKPDDAFRIFADKVELVESEP